MDFAWARRIMKEKPVRYISFAREMLLLTLL